MQSNERHLSHPSLSKHVGEGGVTEGPPCVEMSTTGSSSVLASDILIGNDFQQLFN